ncbi:hypothetical protein L596_016521 [Steinernema carpocapsae]|uniref:Uncharacterized protein n=1 Tax=Steinernema carpocapsae TaxID=34508 RepID=A0A4U5NIZ8_STECR|nr:hypothetical protein L596_016521 [Steinernema carpocapsae]
MGCLKPDEPTKVLDIGDSHIQSQVEYKCMEFKQKEETIYEVQNCRLYNGSILPVGYDYRNHSSGDFVSCGTQGLAIANRGSCKVGDALLEPNQMFIESSPIENGPFFGTAKKCAKVVQDNQFTFTVKPYACVDHEHNIISPGQTTTFTNVLYKCEVSKSGIYGFVPYTRTQCHFNEMDYEFEKIFRYRNDQYTCAAGGEIKKTGCAYESEMMKIGEVKKYGGAFVECEQDGTGFVKTEHADLCIDAIGNTVNIGEFFENREFGYVCEKSPEAGSLRGFAKVAYCVYGNVHVKVEDCSEGGNGKYVGCLPHESTFMIKEVPKEQCGIVSKPAMEKNEAVKNSVPVIAQFTFQPVAESKGQAQNGSKETGATEDKSSSGKIRETLQENQEGSSEPEKDETSSEAAQKISEGSDHTETTTTEALALNDSQISFENELAPVKVPSTVESMEEEDPFKIFKNIVDDSDASTERTNKTNPFIDLAFETQYPDQFDDAETQARHGGKGVTTLLDMPSYYPEGSNATLTVYPDGTRLELTVFKALNANRLLITTTVHYPDGRASKITRDVMPAKMVTFKRPVTENEENDSEERGFKSGNIKLSEKTTYEWVKTHCQVIEKTIEEKGDLTYIHYNCTNGYGYTDVEERKKTGYIRTPPPKTATTTTPPTTTEERSTTEAPTKPLTVTEPITEFSITEEPSTEPSSTTPEPTEASTTMTTEEPSTVPKTTPEPTTTEATTKLPTEPTTELPTTEETITTAETTKASTTTASTTEASTEPPTEASTEPTTEPSAAALNRRLKLLLQPKPQRLLLHLLK